MSKNFPDFTNALIHETSPYLLQHAHNPVAWRAWNDESLDFAKKENKLLIISVGYSACHWCHVMEHESFENEEVAKVMNRDFVNIKVDREERPDIDQVYMNALQVMTGSGGWPMNIVALPDGRPVWGGTYVQKNRWMETLKQLSKLFAEQPEQMEDYANRLDDGLQRLQIIEAPEEIHPFSKGFYAEILQKWKSDFDMENGGPKGAPKFMMPNNYNFLLRYAFQENDTELMEYINITLTKMANGGIFDHIGGGFSRYSVDERWHIPHFEKMLYDNAQLVSLYSQAFKLTKNELYKNVVFNTLNFIQEELTAKNHSFYSALDADSLNEKNKNEEGAFYSWTKEELQDLLKEDFKIFTEIFNINAFGKWEEDSYVLIRTKASAEIAKLFNLSEEEIKAKESNWIKKLKNEREKRSKPGLDDKSLTSWNALMISGYLDAYSAFGNDEYLNAALKNANFIKEIQLKKDGRLWHTYKNGQSRINAYLEDYAFCIEAFLKLYEVIFDENWLNFANDLCKVCLEDFTDEKSPLFYFTSSTDRALITRNIEVTDNVIPASNSVMAKNLFKLSKLTGEPAYLERAEAMLNSVQSQIKSYPRGYSNWMDLMLNFTHPYFEIVIAGENSENLNREILKNYIPNCIISGSINLSELPLLQHRNKENETLIYVCEEGKCELPVKSTSEALEMIKHV